MGGGHVRVQPYRRHAGVDPRVLQPCVLDDQCVSVALRLVHVPSGRRFGAREVKVKELSVVLPLHLESLLVQRMGLDLAHEFCPLALQDLHILQQILDVDIA